MANDGMIARRDVLKGLAGVAGMAALVACTPSIGTSSAPSASGPPSPGGSPEPRSPEPSGTAGAKNYDGVKLTMIAQSGTAYQPALETWAKEFLQITGAEVTYDFTPWEGMLTKAATALSSPGSVDMFLSDVEFEYSLYTSLLDLSDRINAAGYDLDGLFASVRKYGAGIGGNANARYGLPLTAATPVTLYRVAKGDPIPGTWDEFNAFLKTNTGGRKYGLAFAASPAAATVKSFLSRFRANGGVLLTPDWTPLINSDAGVKALTLLKSQMAYTPEGMLAWDDAQAAAAFLNGDVAVLETWASFIMPKIQDPSASKVVDQWTLAPLPGNPGGHFTQHNGTIFKDSANPNAAFDFLAYITSPEQATRMMIEFKEDSARKTAWQDPAVLADRPYLKDLAVALEVAKPFTPGYASWVELFVSLGEAAQAVIAGTQEPKAALDDAAAKWTEVLDRAKPPFPYSE